MLDPAYQHLVVQLHFYATLFMTGLIWFVQVVHYPFLHYAEGNLDAARFHQRRTGWVVIPVMVVELVTAVLLLGSSWIAQYGDYLFINLGLLLLTWAVTFLKMVPLHRRLLEHMDESTIQVIVTTNWVRTILWTVRSLVLMRFLG